MVDEYDEQAEGVTFWFVRSSLTESRGKEKFGAKLELTATVGDEELWKEMLKKFQQGFRIHSSPDFHIEVLDVMRGELKGLKDKITLLERALEQEKDSHRQTGEELGRYKEPFSALGRSLMSR